MNANVSLFVCLILSILLFRWYFIGNFREISKSRSRRLFKNKCWNLDWIDVWERSNWIDREKCATFHREYCWVHSFISFVYNRYKIECSVDILILLVVWFPNVLVVRNWFLFFCKTVSFYAAMIGFCLDFHISIRK